MTLRRAFSLLEIIVAIVMIAILATLTIYSVKKKVIKSSDIQRVDDVKQMQQALDIYRQKTGHYPAALTGGQPLFGPDGQVILAKVPTSPQPSDCRVANYLYKPIDGGLSYNLVFCLANPYSDVPAGRCVADPANFCNILGEGCLWADCVWQYIGSPGFTSGPANTITLAMTKFAELFVAFRDGDNGGKVNVMSYDFGDSGIWSGVQSASLLALQSGQAAYPVISIYNHDNSNKYAYLALSDLGDGGRPKVFAYEYTTNDPWHSFSTGLPTTAASFLSLVVDKKTAYLAFQDMGMSGKASVMKNVDLGTWSYVGTRGFSSGAASQISLDNDSGNNLYVAFHDGGPNKVSVLKNSGSTWNKLGASASVSAGNASSISLTVMNGQPCVGYVDYSASHKATVMCYNGNAWIALGGEGFSAGQVDNTVLVSYGNNLYISYLDKYNDNKTTVLEWSGTTWLPVGPAGFSPSGVTDPSLTTFSNNLYVGFSDPNNAGQISVMGYQ